MAEESAELQQGAVLPAELLRRLPGAGRTRVLYFMRTAECPVCVGHLKQLEGELSRLERLGASVIAFVPEPGATVQIAGRPAIFPVVSGPDAYGQLGLRRAVLGQVQQSGTAVVDASGRLVLIRRATIPFNALDAKQLFAVLEQHRPAPPAAPK